MAFSEATKLLIKKRAHFACCMCRNVGVEIHHIVPQADGGPDTEDNGAPLCPTCHETYGANPTKRKLIRESRDHWYEVCEARYASDVSRIDLLHDLIKGLPTKADIGEMLAEVTASYGLSAAEYERNEHPDSVLLTQAVGLETVRQYLRWLYCPLKHCGPKALKEILDELLAADYKTIGELHAVLGRTKQACAEFVQDTRDEGKDTDYLDDAKLVKLFLGMFDQRYCMNNFPRAYKSISAKETHTWFRSLPQA